MSRRVVMTFHYKRKWTILINPKTNTHTNVLRVTFDSSNNSSSRTSGLQTLTAAAVDEIRPPPRSGTILYVLPTLAPGHWNQDDPSPPKPYTCCYARRFQQVFLNAGPRDHAPAAPSWRRRGGGKSEDVWQYRSFRDNRRCPDRLNATHMALTRGEGEATTAEWSQWGRV